MDVCLVAAMVTRVRRDAFAEELLDRRDERVVVRQSQVREGNIRCTQAAGERRSVVGLWVGDTLGGDLALPEIVGDLGLGNAVGG